MSRVINKNLIILSYAFLIIIISIIYIIFQITILSDIVRITFYISFYVLSSIVVYFIYTMNKLNGLIILIVFISFVFVSTNTLLILPMFALIPCIFIKNIKKQYKVLSSLSTLVVSIIFLVVMISLGLGKESIAEKIKSPDGKYTLIKLYSDEGAMGGHTVVKVERNYCNIISVKKTLLVENSFIRMEWINNNNVRLNGNDIKILIP